MAANSQEDLAMQVRCVHCRREQWMIVVYPISLGECPCAWCGEMSKRMTNTEYQAALAAAEGKEIPDEVALETARARGDC